MRSFGAIILAAAFACSTDAFTTQNTLGRPSLMTLGATETATETDISMASIRKDIAQLTADNFDATLKKVEPFLLNDAGVTFHAKCVKRIKVQAGALGATGGLPIICRTSARVTVYCLTNLCPLGTKFSHHK